MKNVGAMRCPKTFIVHPELNEIDLFADFTTNSATENTWIYKPDAQTGGGGIMVFTKPVEIIEYSLSQLTTASNLGEIYGKGKFT